MRPNKEQLAKWRELAESTFMVSAVGEYTPQEFTVLLDEVDLLQRQRDAALALVEKWRKRAAVFVEMGNDSPRDYNRLFGKADSCKTCADELAAIWADVERGPAEK